jgi:pyruvate dehydrogenase E2 component (dihydrolipoamide acetyltransferase)
MHKAGPADDARGKGERISLTGMRRAIAALMSKSAREIPHFTVSRKIDAGNLLATYERLNSIIRSEPLEIPKLTVTDFIVKAAAVALRRFPYLNASFYEEDKGGGSIVIWEDINIGLAMATEMGLIVPVIHRADAMGLAGIASARETLFQKAQKNRFAVRDLQGGTFTVSNLGPMGADRFTAIINAPECAILSVGRAVKEAVVVEDAVGIRPMMDFTVNIDHRVVDGVYGARFLKEIDQILNNTSDWNIKEKDERTDRNC